MVEDMGEGQVGTVGLAPSKGGEFRMAAVEGRVYVARYALRVGHTGQRRLAPFMLAVA